MLLKNGVKSNLFVPNNIKCFFENYLKLNL